MKFFETIAGYLIFAAQALLLFLLLFGDRVEVPSLLQAFGRLHPLVLHLPIGLLLVTAILVFFRKPFESDSFERMLSFLLYLTSLAASGAALMGFFLSKEGGYDHDNLELHKWLGIAVSVVCWPLPLAVRRPVLLKLAVAGAVLLLVFTGHVGASLTHGENFVLAPLQEHPAGKRIITDSTTLFIAAVATIFESKCYSCHSSSKAKGGLVLTSWESMLKGGDEGALWHPGDPANSLLVTRMRLPIDHKEHMPPKDKTQLLPDEVAFISEWIRSGANPRIELRELRDTDSLKILAEPVIARYTQPEAGPVYNFSFAPPALVAGLNAPYRSVFQIAQNEPALQADFFLGGAFEKKYLEDLAVVKEQLVALNLSRMPLRDADLAALSGFTNLEKIVLNNTPLDGSGLSGLADLPRLKIVSLAGTTVNAAAARSLGASASIKTVFVWNTRIADDELEGLRKDFPSISWDSGYKPDEREMLQLSPPFLKDDHQLVAADERIFLRHKLPGVIIRYDLSGACDSLSSPQFDDPIMLQKYTVLKSRAYKDGWLTSDEKEYIFFVKGVKPNRAELTTRPNERYLGEGAATLTDGKKGMPDFYRDPVWMGFREEPLEAYFFFDSKNPPTVNAITLSYARNVYAMCMPPATFEVWGGNNPKRLKLLKKMSPEQPSAWVGTRIEGVTAEIQASRYSCYKIVARPLAKLPEFRDAKKEKGWLMVDEVFFN